MELTFRLARQRVGLSLREAAKSAGIGYNTLQKLEGDTSKIKMEIAKKLADIYYIDPFKLYYGKEEDYIKQVKSEFLAR
ncbi:helix-turn-helix domain-containing protein [Bacillus cereus]|uniref:helix-turn-helix domain-containing protein n=1 Tax=Bacillus cereus TaxID=1396 RepID=UPI00187A221A|nr:helix-turn-helix transcriptional regulator [Bacillus cereus]MBE7096534.1 helix-turn-helix transcriptional regulator [Bacillus cereus]